MQYDFPDNTLLICPNDYKEKVLDFFSTNKIIRNIQYLTIQEFKKNYLFDYDVNTIKYLVDKYKLSVENAKEILNNLYFVNDNQDYHNEKLDKLVSYKKELISNNLLQTNPLFKKSIANKNVVVAGYGKIDSFTKSLLSNAQVIEYPSLDKEYSYYSFKNMEDEVDFIYNQIFDLLNKGININDILIMNANSDYESYFKRFNTYYDSFKVELNVDDYLIGTTLGKEFLSLIDSCSKEELYEIFKEKENGEQIIGIINKYVEYDLKDVKELIIDDLKKTVISKPYFTNVVKCVPLLTEISETNHIFLVGFNDNTPTSHRDIEYITDNIANLVGKDTSEQLNILDKENVKAYLSSINNLTISYCEKSPFNKYNLSTLFETNIAKLTYKPEFTYSNRLNQTKYGYMLDELRKFNTDNEMLSSMYKSYQNNNYLDYDNSFNGTKIQQDKVTLSYTSMNEFYQCQFRYYLDNILKIKINDDIFFSKIGTLCHDVLEHFCLNKNTFDFDKQWQDSLNQVNSDLDKKTKGNRVYTNSMEEFFTNKVKEEMKDNINIIKEQLTMTSLSNNECEKKFEFKVMNNVTFKGFIDKLQYLDVAGGNRIVTVVDYKTGNSTKIRPDYFQYGLSLQLPSYLYLLSNCDDVKFKNADIGGFYLQHIINNDLKFDEDKTKDEIKKDSMKLEGFTTNDGDRLDKIDTSLKTGPSQFIKSLRLKKDGSFYSTAKVLSDDEMKEYKNIVEEKIKNAGQKILDGDFQINPKIINGNNESCAYCPYLAICHRQERNKEYLFTKKEGDEE